MPNPAILVLNSGSSSLKFGLFTRSGEQLVEGTVDGIDGEHGSITLQDASGKPLHAEDIHIQTPSDALHLAADRLATLSLPPISAVGHRVVHGGPQLLDHTLITPEVLATLRDATHFAPLHIPPALDLIEEAQKRYPAQPHYACFDTAFHKTMPDAAKLLPLPRRFWDQGVRRYGFHGLSYASIVHTLDGRIPPRLVIAHLGSGCSVCALRDGRSVDTSMGLTPTGGVVMATRPGDLDPGTILYLLRQGTTPDELETMLNQECGLKGLTTHSDIRDLEQAAEAGSAEASLALEVFYRTIAKTIAGYATVLGDIDQLIFTGGIGQHSERTRNAITTRLAFLNIPKITALPAKEEAQIARICWALLPR